MARQRRYFPPEFKAEAVRLSREGGRSVTAVARDLGIRPDLLREWRRVVGPAPDAAAPPGAADLAAEVRRLRRENEVLRQERDFLKRAAAYFAKAPR
jgi:transposase